MRRRRKWARRIGRSIGTLAIGAFLGFLVPTVITEYAPRTDVGAPAPVPEAPVARRFIEAFLADDQGALTQMGMSADVKLRASRFRSDYKRVDGPIYLGSYIGGGYSLHAYTVKVLRPDDSEDLVSWRVITQGGQVALLPPPRTIEQE